MPLDPSYRRAPRRAPVPRIRIGAAVSLSLHLLVVALLVVTLDREEREAFVPPASPVQVVFESGNRQGPSAPEPSVVPSEGPPTAKVPPSSQPPVPPGPDLPLPPAPPPSPPVAEKPPMPQPALPQPEAPAEPLTPPTEPKPTEPKLPVAEPPPPESKPAPSEPLPTPPPPPPGPEAEAPKPPPPAKAPPVVPTPAPRPAPRPPRPPMLAQPQPPPQPQFKPAKPGDFPMPMAYSVGGPKAPSSKAQQASSGVSRFEFGPVRKGAENNTPFGDVDDDNGGPDWRNLLIRWVQNHAYYPPEARANLEEGTARVHVEARPDGKVTSVELVGRSGSIWLDMALQALFRDQRIPQVPGSDKPIVFNFTMHYIIVRRASAR